MFRKGTKEGLLWIGIVLGVAVAILPGVLYKVAKKYKALKAKEMRDKVVKFYK